MVRRSGQDRVQRSGTLHYLTVSGGTQWGVPSFVGRGTFPPLPGTKSPQGLERGPTPGVWEPTSSYRGIVETVTRPVPKTFVTRTDLRVVPPRPPDGCGLRSRKTVTTRTRRKRPLTVRRTNIPTKTPSKWKFQPRDPRK